MPARSDSVSELAALELLEAAMNLAPGQREAFIASRGDCSASVRERALELLSSDKDGTARLQTGGASASLYGNAEIAPDIPGYRIIRQLGRGGMGAVWLAKRDTSDFEHAVAIKIIKPGALSGSLIERFRRERQILAQLNHPNIARLYDGGQTEENQPFIVMEHVAGATLRQWLTRDPAPPLDEKIALFRQVAAAVAFAHQNLIVHRDLTPGNILVDERGQAKLIDFGIARPPRTVEEPSKASGVTGLSLTPGFAAPERARGEGSNTLADVYSLGRILEMMIDRTDVPELSAIAKHAADYAPEDRYLGVGEMIEDIDRFTAGRAIDSYSKSRRYRFIKFATRQKVLVGGGAALFFALAGGLAATSWSYLRAESARAQAEQRFDEVRALANFMLYDLYDELEPVTGNTRALTRIADRTSGYLETLSRERDTNRDLMLETANGFKRLSDVLGNPEDRNLGQREQAGKALRKSVAMLERLHGEHPGDVEITRSLAKAQFSLGVFVFIAEDLVDEAIPPAQRATQLYETLVRSGAGEVADRIALIEARLQAAKPLVWKDEGARAVAAIKQLAPQIGSLVARYPDDKAVLTTQGRILSSLSSAMSWTYDLTEERGAFLGSIPPSDDAIAIFEKLHTRHPDDQTIQRSLLGAHFVRALIYYDLDEWQRAHLDLEAAENLATDLLAQDPDDSELSRRLQGFRGQHAPILVALGRYDEAVAIARLALGERERLLAKEPDNAGYFRDRTSARRALGETLLLAKREREGCRVYRQALDEWQIIRRRWGITALNQSNDVDTIRKALQECRAKGLPVG